VAASTGLNSIGGILPASLPGPDKNGASIGAVQPAITSAATTGYVSSVIGTQSGQNMTFPFGKLNIQSGDLLILAAVAYGSGPFTTASTPTGFTAISPSGSESVALNLWYKVATGTESGSLTLATALTPGQTFIGALLQYRGISNTPLDATTTLSSTTYNSATQASPSITTTTTNDLIVWIAVDDSPQTPISIATGTIRSSFLSTAGNVSFAVADSTKATAGTATNTWTYASAVNVSTESTNTDWTGAVLALKTSTLISASVGKASGSVVGSPVAVIPQTGSAGIATGSVVGTPVGGLVLTTSIGIASGSVTGQPSLTSLLGGSAGIATGSVVGSPVAVIPQTGSAGIATGSVVGSPVGTLLLAGSVGIATDSVTGTPSATLALTLSIGIATDSTLGSPSLSSSLAANVGIGTDSTTGTPVGGLVLTTSIGIASGSVTGQPSLTSLLGGSVGIATDTVVGTPNAALILTCSVGIPLDSVIGSPVVGLFYRIYAGNTSGGPVDYTTVLASTVATSWTSAALAPGTSQRFAVRVYDPATGYDDGNVDAVITITLDSSGCDISSLPNAPTALTASPGPSGTLVLRWAVLTPPGSTNAPSGFYAYLGTGSLSYGTPAATVPYVSGLTLYTATLSGLTDGTTYTIGVRAFNAIGSEANTATTTATASTTGPLPISSLTGVAL